jgi:uncharacterized membrane protein
VDDADLERLTARVAALEREVAQLRYGIGPPPPAAPASAAPEPGPAAPAPAAPAPAAPAPRAAAAPKARGDVESVVGGRGLLYAGALLILVGVASFLKIAFDRGWIGPPMRVALGLIAGAALIAAASALRKRLHPFFADAIVGLGAGIAYLSFYGAGAMYHVLPLLAVALGTFVLTAALCLIAYRQNRQPLAFFGIVGGLIAPLLLGGDGQDSLFFYTYLAVLSGAAIVLGELRGWRALPVVSLIGTAFYWLAFSLENDAHKFAVRLSVAVVLYAIYSSAMLLAWRKREPVDAWRVTVAAINAAWFFFGITALASGHAATLAVIFIAIAGLHLLAGLRLDQRQQFWLATIALSFAIPPVCSSFSPLAPPQAISTAMHLAWAAEATLVGVLGARWNDRVLFALAGTLFATDVIHTIAAYGTDELRPLFNDRFASLLACAIGIAVVRRELTVADAAAGKVRAVGKILIDLIVLFAVTPEAARIGNAVQPGSDGTGGSVAISIAWALYGGALIAFGIRQKDAVSRWDGLALLGITVMKLLLIDLTEFDIVFRVISALGLGTVMLVMAFLYQSRLRAPKAGK